MKKSGLILVCVCSLLALSFLGTGCSSDSSTSPTETIDVTGKWSLSADGYRAMSMTLTQSGTTITGSSAGYRGSISGSIDGDKITLTITFQDLQKTTFSGTVSGTSMSGTYRGGYPNSTVYTGSWSAKKQ